MLREKAQTVCNAIDIASPANIAKDIYVPRWRNTQPVKKSASFDDTFNDFFWHVAKTTESIEDARDVATKTSKLLEMMVTWKGKEDTIKILTNVNAKTLSTAIPLIRGTIIQQNLNPKIRKDLTVELIKDEREYIAILKAEEEERLKIIIRIK